MIKTFKSFLAEDKREPTTTQAFEEIVSLFIPFAADALELDDLPNFSLNSEGSGRSFGSYGGNQINLNVEGRHPMDVLRTLAHEMTHYKQDLHDQLTHESGETGSPEENEANMVAGIIMRDFGRTYPELFSLGPILGEI